MQFADKTRYKGELEILLLDATGRIKTRRQVPNLVVTTGLDWLSARTVGTPPAMSHMAVGTGTTAPVLVDVALGAELARVALSSQVSAGNVATFSATFAAGIGTGAITEAGVFNAAVDGTMLNRATFPVVNKDVDDTMQINWTLTQQ